MAEPLKNSYGPEIPRCIADMIQKVHPRFESAKFIRDVLKGYDDLELLPRGRHIATVLHSYLPEDFEKAVDILIRSIATPMDKTGANGMSSFLYMPHAHYVATYGLDHFQASMEAQYRITQLFTAEFSIRPFLVKHTAKTLAQLDKWTKDPNEHVRRLVSEGSRPRLPWAMRLPAFQKDPTPVLKLLEKLKDDPSLYVRRSVANNLNDIGKDHPDILIETAQRWSRGAGPERHWLITRALRSSVKRGEAAALSILGYDTANGLVVVNGGVSPLRVKKGGRVNFSFEVENRSKQSKRVAVDYRVHYRKANGRTTPKVFKHKSLQLEPGKREKMSIEIKLHDLTTRKHYPGVHRLEAQLNGKVFDVGEFALL